MSLQTQRAFVEARVQNFMAENYPLVPIAFFNAPFSQPDGPFIAVYLMDGDGFRANLGARYVVRHPGVLQIDVYQPENSGSVLMTQLCDGIAPLFQEQKFQLADTAKLTFRAFAYPPAPVARGFARTMMRCNYYRDEMSDSVLPGLKPIYWGVSVSPSLDADGVLALGGEEMASSFVKTVIYNCTGGRYPYFAIPASFGVPASVMIGSLAFSAFTVSSVNINGEDYNVLRFNFIQHGAAISVMWA